MVEKSASYLEDLGFIYRANAEMDMANLRFVLFSFRIEASANVLNDSYNCIWKQYKYFYSVTRYCNKYRYCPPNKTSKSTTHKFSGKGDFMH